MPLSQKRPWTLAAQSKDAVAAPKIYETVYADAMSRAGLDVIPGRAPYAVLDHFIEKLPENGGYKETGIKGLGDRTKLKPTETRARENLFKSRLLKDMAENHGYYYYSGKGDTGRMYFYSPHPLTNQFKATDFSKMFPGKKNKAIYDRLRRDFSRDMDNQFVSLNTGVHVDKKAMTKKQAETYFDNAFISNALWAVETNGLTGKGFEKGFKHLIDNSDIKNLKNFNKRSQIWMTEGYALESKFMQDNLSKKVKPKLKESLKRGTIPYILINDPAGEKLFKDSKAEDYVESIDGKILIHPDYIDAMNAAFGMPFSGQNKSFIVSPDATHGALLGKFMFHKASGRAAKWMEDNGQGMVVWESSAKDVGSRRKSMMDLTVDSKFNVKTSKPVKENTFELPMEHIKGSLSEKQTQHMIDNQKTPKQLMVNMVKWAHKDIPQSVINDMFDKFIKTNYVGVEESNNRLAEYIKKDPSKLTEAEFDRVVKDIDKIGLPNLIDAIKNTKHHKLTS